MSIDDRDTVGPTGLPVVPAADIARGWPHGYDGGRFAADGAHDDGPAAALRALVRQALLRPPCIVSFSGGRDSSIVLSVAAAVATEEGLPAPVAVTFRYPGDPAADESAHQERVVSHLRATGLGFEWVCQEIDDEFDLLGPMTTEVVAAHGGPTWPPVIGPSVLLGRMAAGGTVLTGEFGDEILGPQRITYPRAVVVRRGRGMSVETWRRAGAAALPAALHRRTVRLGEDECPWLVGPGRAELLRLTRKDAAVRPLRWDRSVTSHMRRRAVRLGLATVRTIAGWTNCQLIEPLGDDRFVTALARAGGWCGLSGRAAATRMVCENRLPPEIVTRHSKAYFNGSRFGPRTREFVQSWDGTGLECHAVDAAVLKAMWARGEFPAQSAMLLQQAWLSSRCGAIPR